MILCVIDHEVENCAITAILQQSMKMSKRWDSGLNFCGNELQVTMRQVDRSDLKQSVSNSLRMPQPKTKMRLK